MDDSPRRDLRAFIPGFAFIVVLAGALALAPSLVPGPIRDALGFGHHRLLPEVEVTGTGSYAFLSHQKGDRDDPVGYDPCKPVKVRINPQDAPTGYLALVKDAMAEVSRDTGLELEYVGTTEDRPHWENEYIPSFLGEPRRTPALVSFASPSEVPQLAGRVAGIGGSVAVSVQGGRFRYVTGGVTLDRAVFRDLARTADGRREARAIVLHELGHLVGLAHVKDSGELMNAENVGLLDFGPGDLAGLAKVGATPCA
ncbi:hypothetical protein [Nocardioides marmorisolisilvae]|uniref:Peptidase M10 metallopeptidase domain-containing protein n=1 Tax=Nocardioides marmorisolisilvae TaxID=1542737 RepID=A0A3N0DPS1_9ACTN|nr:hypothetical protein [Nocardioides marmorisolisilvae]RNL77649.1 hypothetical protein EFL95_16715 [Nocardioides marmorisolisilvae]